MEMCSADRLKNPTNDVSFSNAMKGKIENNFLFTEILKQFKERSVWK